MKTKISLSFARLLQSLIIGEVNAGSFTASNKKMLGRFIDDNVLDFRIIGNQQKKIFCADHGNLRSYLHHKFAIASLEDYISFLEKEETQRSEAAKAVSDTKFRRTKVFTGFLLNCYDVLRCELEGVPFLVNPVNGAYTFVSAYRHFRIPHDVTVVVVEGHENFRELARQRYLFEGIKPLFVWRYQNSKAIAKWLNLIPNQYIHFGDIDPKGIHIYLSEFKSKVTGDRGQFFIPPDLEMLFRQYGDRLLFEKQEKFLPLIVDKDPALASVVRLIQKHKKGLAQEILIK